MTPVAKGVYVAVMISLIVVIDLTFLRGSNHTLERLITNVAIVGVFLGAYFAFVG